jgi:hypothetical protein
LHYILVREAAKIDFKATVQHLEQFWKLFDGVMPMSDKLRYDLLDSVNVLP